MLLASIMKSSRGDTLSLDFLWMFSVWLESFAMFPQAQLLWKSSPLNDHAVKDKHFASATFVASLAFAIFWTKDCIGQYNMMMRGYSTFYYGMIFTCVVRVSISTVCVCRTTLVA